MNRDTYKEYQKSEIGQKAAKESKRIADIDRADHENREEIKRLEAEAEKFESAKKAAERLQDKRKNNP